MTSGVSVKPTIGGLQLGAERTHTGPTRTVSTELADAVSAASAGDQVRPDPLRTATLEAETHDLVLDAQGREVIYQAIEWSRRVTRQVPAAAARRISAYARPARNNHDKDEEHADIEV